MKKLTKEQQALIDASIVALSKDRDEITELIEEYNEFVNEWGEKLEKKIEEYNDNINDLRGVYEGIAETAQEYFDERTENWQNSDNGQAYQEWINDLENPAVEDFDFDIPGIIEAVDFQDWDNSDEFLPPDEPG